MWLREGRVAASGGGARPRNGGSQRSRGSAASGASGARSGGAFERFAQARTLFFSVSANTGRGYLYDAAKESLAANFLPEDFDEGGVAAAYKREIESAPDPEKRRIEIEEHLLQFRNPFRTAEA